MANQMIALGVRGPQLPDLGATSARMSNIMANTAVAREKQAGIARANAFRQLVSSPEFDAANPEHIKAAQALDPEGAAQIAGAFDKRNIDRVKYVNDFFETSLFVLSKAQNPQQLALAAGVLDKNFPDFKEFVGRTVEDIVSDPEGFDAGRNKALFRTQKAAEQIPYLMPKAKAELGYGLKGEMQNVVTGGAPGVAGVFPLEQFRLKTPTTARTGTVELGEQTTVEGGQGGPMVAPESVSQMMPGAKSPRLSASMASSLLGLKNNSDYQVALQAIRKADPAAAEELRRIMPVFDPALSDAIREAAMAEFEVIPQGGQPGLVTGERGGMGGPYEPTGRQAMGKSPAVSPYPGSAQVPLPRVAGEARAAEGGKQGVRVRTEPVIAGGSKAAELRAQRNNEYPEATGRMKANLARIDNIIETAEALRKHPAYRRIIGPIDAFTPNITPSARGAQELLKTLSALGAVDELQKMRQESPTGGSVGNASDADIQLLREGFGALGQSQGEDDFDVSLRGLINRARQTRARIANQYRDTYSYRLPKNWTPPPVTKTRPGTPTGQGRKAGEFIVMEPE